MSSNIELKNLLLPLALVILLAGCEEQETLSRMFVVQKGEHYASPRLVQTIQSNTLDFRATFNESAIYEFEDKSLQDSKNKLLGFSDCNSLHHDNSARFAWQWYNGRLEIFAYCYINGERREEFVGIVKLNEENRYKLKVTEGNYIFQLNNQEPVHMERAETCDRGVYYMLWPYFGGTLPAPHDISVSIQID